MTDDAMVRRLRGRHVEVRKGYMRTIVRFKAGNQTFPVKLLWDDAVVPNETPDAAQWWATQFAQALAAVVAEEVGR
jgi:hypothetical protein